DLERHLQVAEVRIPQLLAHQLLDWGGIEDVGAGTDGPAYGARRRGPVDLTGERRGPPQGRHPFDDLEGGSVGQHRTVDRADARAQHEVGGDVALEEGPQHAHLDGTEQAAATEHECSLHIGNYDTGAGSAARPNSAG